MDEIAHLVEPAQPRRLRHRVSRLEQLHALADAVLLQKPVGGGLETDPKAAAAFPHAHMGGLRQVGQGDVLAVVVVEVGQHGLDALLPQDGGGERGHRTLSLMLQQQQPQPRQGHRDGVLLPQHVANFEPFHHLSQQSQRFPLPVHLRNQRQDLPPTAHRVGQYVLLFHPAAGEEAQHPRWEVQAHIASAGGEVGDGVDAAAAQEDGLTGTEGVVLGVDLHHPFAGGEQGELQLLVPVKIPQSPAWGQHPGVGHLVQLHREGGVGVAIHLVQCFLGHGGLLCSEFDSFRQGYDSGSDGFLLPYRGDFFQKRCACGTRI